jgi:hypothetical protein
MLDPAAHTSEFDYLLDREFVVFFQTHMNQQDEG